jgi:hypothetical protein
MLPSNPALFRSTGFSRNLEETSGPPKGGTTKHAWTCVPVLGVIACKGARACSEAIGKFDFMFRHYLPVRFRLHSASKFESTKIVNDAASITTPMVAAPE